MKHLEAIIKKTNDQTVFKTLGIEIIKLDADETIVSMAIDHRHLQHAGLVHGGIYVLLAESAASLAGACTLKNPHQGIVALEINANHVRSARGDKLTARSKNIHSGKKTLVYEARVEDSDGQLISIARCTLMLLD